MAHSTTPGYSTSPDCLGGEWALKFTKRLIVLGMPIEFAIYFGQKWYAQRLVPAPELGVLDHRDQNISIPTIEGLPEHVT